jgi:hypothetical protein
MPCHPLRRTLHAFPMACLACAGVLASFAASAFPSPASPVAVVEYYNVDLHHYFLTAHPDEMRDIAAGLAGPGWTRTGWAFSAYPAGSTFCPGDCGAPVSRFYSAFSNSHFYTADAAEAAAIQAPGSEWMLEAQEFEVPVPDAGGHCAAWQVPVYRLYNGRFALHDSNHRFVTDAGERARMVAQGWIDEGVRFCALGAGEVPIESYAIVAAPTTRVMPSAQCEDESINRGPCIAINNLPTPSAVLPTVAGDTPEAFSSLTGQPTTIKLFVVPPASIESSPRFAFVQDAGNTIGVHVDTNGRGASPYSSVNPLYQFHSTVAAGQFDDRFFPFGPHESPVELAVHFTLNVKSIEARGASSAAYGHPTLEFIDQRSGHHLYFTVMTYGTPPAVPAGDYLAPDVGTGKVIVGTTFRVGSPYITSLGLPTLATPSTGFVAPNPWGWGGYFEFRVDEAQFQRILDAARTVDAALSASAADYLLDNFHFNNEVFGDGEIGINLAGYTLELVRR